MMMTMTTMMTTTTTMMIMIMIMMMTMLLLMMTMMTTMMMTMMMMMIDATHILCQLWALCRSTSQSFPMVHVQTSGEPFDHVRWMGQQVVGRLLADQRLLHRRNRGTLGDPGRWVVATSHLETGSWTHKWLGISQLCYAGVYCVIITLIVDDLSHWSWILCEVEAVEGSGAGMYHPLTSLQKANLSRFLPLPMKLHGSGPTFLAL